MKNANRSILTLIILALYTLGNSQNPVAVVDFMKVKPGNTGAYLEVEKEWKKIHQASLDQGIITTWILYQKMYAGAADPYQFITVSIYDDFKKTENPIPWEWVEENYTEEEMENMMEMTLKSRVLVRSEFYNWVTGVEEAKPSRYMFINRMKVKPGKWGEYADFEKEIVKPMFEEAVSQGYRTNWNVWSKWLGEDDFQFVTVDAYGEYGQWNDEQMNEIAMKVHPGKSMDELMGKVSKLRSGISRELWKVVDIVTAPPGQ